VETETWYVADAADVVMYCNELALDQFAELMSDGTATVNAN
jgi:hypothetical protein